MVIEYYKKKFREEAKKIDLDEYMGMASPGGLEYLDQLAAKGYEGRMHEEQLEELQQRIQDKAVSSDQYQCGIPSFAGRKRCLSVSYSPWQIRRKSFQCHTDQKVRLYSFG